MHACSGGSTQARVPPGTGTRAGQGSTQNIHILGYLRTVLLEVAIQHEACLSAQHQTWRMPGFRKAATVSPSGPTLTRCISSSLGTSPTNSSRHRGKDQTQDARAGSFGSHRLGGPMTQQAPGCASPPRPQILEPGELPEEEVRGTWEHRDFKYGQAERVGQGQGRSWQHSGFLAAVPRL